MPRTPSSSKGCPSDGYSPDGDSSHGAFKLFYRKGWAYLTVYPQEQAGKPVYPEEIENRMRLLHVPPASSRRIRQIIEQCSGKPEPLVEWPAGRALAASITVTVSEDEMSATVIVRAPKKGAAPPTLADVLEELDHAGVVSGIDDGRIRSMLARREYGVPINVATALSPILGRGHRIVFHFNTNRGKPYLEMDFGRINLKELNFIENCHAGDLLAELEPPIEPVDGRTVTGRVVPAEVDRDSVQLSAGMNTVLDPDQTRLYAECEGNVRIKDGMVLVEPVVTVRNVNYETGNIHFEGSIVVEGSIADGFIVEADGDIQVGRGVGRATLKAGGNVLLKTGISGNGEGTIDCGGNLFAKYIESSTVTCHGHVLVEEAIMHSRLTAFGHCVLNGRRSEVIASKLIVGGSLWCKKLGNVYEAATEAAIGVEPNTLLAYRSAMIDMEAKQEEWNKTERQLDQIERALHEGRNDTRLQQARAQLQTTIMQLGSEIAKLRERTPHLQRKIRASRQSIVVVEEMMFKGATLTFGNLEYRVPEKGVRKTVLKAVEDEIVESGFNYHNRPKLVFE